MWNPPTRSAALPSGQPSRDNLIDFFIDAEFIELGASIDLVSLAVVSADGREMYAISSEFDPSQANVFVRSEVLPQLESRSDAAWMPRAQIRRQLESLVGDDVPRFWSWGGAPYDWMVIAYLFSPAERMPDGWRYTAYDITLLAEYAGYTLNPLDLRLPEPTATVHHALADARWAREVFDYLRAL